MPPDAPEQITPNGTGAGTPTAPDQVQDDGSGAGSPTAPEQVQDDGSGAGSPDAPAQLAIDGGNQGHTVISGTLNPNAAGAIYPAGTFSGKVFYTSDGLPSSTAGTWVRVMWALGLWKIQVFIDGSLQSGYWDSSEDVPTPDLVTWAAKGGATGTPSISTGVSAPDPIQS